MKGLAEYVMSSRYRALLVAMASAGTLLFCWVGAAITALVTLRKGPAQGAWVLLWASLPALVVMQISGDSTPLALLAGTFVLALVLRVSVSLALAVLASAAVGVLTGLLTLVFAEAMLAQLSQVFAEFLQALQASSGSEGQALVLAPPGPAQLAGMMGGANAVLAVLCLLLARYWQAALYKPGGFAAEFRALRYPPGLTLTMVALALALAGMGLEYRPWTVSLLVPLTVVGFALLHTWAALRGRGATWLGAMYVLWAIFDVIKLVLVGLAVADAWMNFRRRWASADGKGDDTR
jgi:hypothetical protein